MYTESPSFMAVGLTEDEQVIIATNSTNLIFNETAARKLVEDLQYNINVLWPAQEDSEE